MNRVPEVHRANEVLRGAVEIVLGVSMTPKAVGLVLVEGDQADGVTLDHSTLEVGAGNVAAAAADQVIAAIRGTRESAAEGGHRLVATGVAWTDHAAAAHLRDALRSHGINDVVLVSELHAAGALAQAIGLAVGCARTALVFVEGDSATLAVVQTADGAVVKVRSGGIQALPEMVEGLDALAAPPQAIFVVGPGLGDIATEEIRSRIAGRTRLPVHAPQDADSALARGAALASVRTPRYEAETIGLVSPEGSDTAAGPTQMAPAGYMTPLGYSALSDEDLADLLDAESEEPADAPQNDRFLLVGSALGAVFVTGVVALGISLAVTIKPAADQRPDIGVPAAPPPAAANPAPAPAPAPQTIQAPVPVVQVAPRTVYVTPAPQAPVVVTAPVVAPVEPAPAAPAPQPAAPAPVPPAPPAVAPIIPPWLRGPQLPSIFQMPGTNPIPAQSVPAQSYPTPPNPSVVLPPGWSGQDRGDRRNPLWPDWSPFG